MADHLCAELPVAALRMAIAAKRPGAGLIHHSDRGIQYASEAYRRVIRSSGFQASMSRKGNCYDNATREVPLKRLKAVAGRRVQGLKTVGGATIISFR
jgi:putative transposase